MGPPQYSQGPPLEPFVPEAGPSRTRSSPADPSAFSVDRLESRVYGVGYRVSGLGVKFRLGVSGPFATNPPEASPTHPDLSHHSCLTECIFLLVLESELPHKTVNLVFKSVIVKTKSTILWGT